MALAGLLIGLSQTYTMMIVFLVLMGVLGGGYHPAAPALISAAVEPKNRGRALGFHMVGGSASYFLAPLIAAGIATVWGWRGSFVGLAVPTAVFGIVFYVLVARRVAAKESGQSATRSDKEAPLAPRRLRRLTAFITLSVVTHAVIFSTVAFVPLFLVDHFGASEETAAAFIAIRHSVGLWASPLGGYLSDRWGRIPVILAVCFSAAPVIYMLNVVSSVFGIGAVLLAIGLLTCIRSPGSQAYVIDQTSERRRSTILGIYFFAGTESGALLTPVMGYLIDRLGFHSSFTIAGVAIVAVTLVCSIWLRGSRS